MILDIQKLRELASSARQDAKEVGERSPLGMMLKRIASQADMAADYILRSQRETQDLEQEEVENG